ncbi:uncharacterized protein LOC144913551 [Branchiostoma floridae x Branchiostoma belcheri]
MEHREKQKLRMRQYRLKKQATNKAEVQAVQTRRAEAATQREKRKKDRNRKREQVLKSQLDKASKQKKSLAVKAWRMRIKLKPRSMPAEDDSDNPFRTRASESRAVKRAKQALPQTPKRKAKVLQQLVKSPTQKKFLEKKGVLLTPEARKSLEVGQGFGESLKEQLCAVKSKGTASPSKRRAYDVLRSVVNKSKSPTALRKKLLIRKTKMKQQDKQ